MQTAAGLEVTRGNKSPLAGRQDAHVDRIRSVCQQDVQSTQLVPWSMFLLCASGAGDLLLVRPGSREMC